ncbi:MAG: hypothetical protein ACR2NW_00925 [Thermodesulfobacteriota bacterium]
MLFPNRLKYNIKRLILIFSLFLISFGTIIGCGSNPPVAPFGSTLTFVPAADAINLCGIFLEPVLFRVLVLNSEGEPINDTVVFFDLSFANENSLIVDTDGNGLPDARLLQMVDNTACSPLNCLNTPIELWFAQGAFVDSPFETTTDDNGVAEVVVLVPGFLNIFNETGQILAAEATMTAFSGAAVITEDFDVNQDCEL